MTRNTQFDPQREQKVHLYVNQRGRKNRGGKAVDNTMCASNHGDLGLKVTDHHERVTCKRCLKLMKGDNPTTHLQTMLTETSNSLSETEDLLDLYRKRTRKLERLLTFVLADLGDRQHVVIHPPTEFSLGELIQSVLNEKIKEPD